MSEKVIISHFENRQQFFEILKQNPGLILVKFSADWCKPCKQIKPVVDAFFLSSPSNVLCAEIDIDTSFDLYAFLKSKKMVNGIPVILCYKKGNQSYIPDDSVTGADPTQLDLFFKRCNTHLQSVVHIK